MSEKIIERLNFHNSWWNEGKISNLLSPSYKRSIFPTLLSYLKLNRVVILKGPRRTGKSTLLYQVMQYLHQSENIPLSQICYISFDDPMLRVDLLEILKNYELLHQFSLSTTPVYLFLDEVHALSDWDSYVKLIFDKKLPIKIFISDSSSSLLTHQSDSLAGRTIEEVILPLSFSEWQNYHEEYSVPSLNSVVSQRFSQYLANSGFMHLQEISDSTLRSKMLLEDVVTKAIYKDSVEIFGLREPAVVEKLFSYLASASSGLVNISKLSSMLGIDRLQTSKYFSFLENTYLLFSLQNYSPLIRESIRSQKKTYLIDQGFGPVYNTSPDNILETMVARHLFCKFPRNVYFWRDRVEVDLVLNINNELIPIEVKNTNVVAKKELLGLFSFSNKYKCKKAYVVYTGLPRVEVMDDLIINFIPVWDFLNKLPF